MSEQGSAPFTAALTQLATSVAANTATVAALERSSATGFDGVGKRLDRIEDRLGGLEKSQAGQAARIEALEEKDRTRSAADRDTATAERVSSAALADSASNYRTLRTVALAVGGTCGAIGAIAELLTLLHGG